MTAQPPPDGREIRRFIGLVLIVVGVLWMGASGLCSAGALVMLFISGGDLREALSTLPMVLLIGGFAIGLGFAVYAIGRALRPWP